MHSLTLVLPSSLVLPPSSLLLPLVPRCAPRMGIGADADAKKWLEANHGPITKEQKLGGSGWASFSKLCTAEGDFFVKTSSKMCEQMFQGEAKGLQAMHATGTIKVPAVLRVADSESGTGSYIVMEYLDMGGRADKALLGRKMAEMHLATPAAQEAQAGRFGFDVPNTIGGTPQPNAWTASGGTAAWVEFFREQRIGHQVKTAGDAKLRREWVRVLEGTDNLQALFDGIPPVRPSVLHGDLWSGNIAAAGGEPVIFDPATYYGHHEAEWGMSWCASLGPDFWRGYRELIPKDAGFGKRAVLYELYHKLNHYNLFGGGYLWDSMGLMSQLCRD